MAMATEDQLKDRERLRRYIEREGLTAVLSDSKWRRLHQALTELPFPVSFRRRDVPPDRRLARSPGLGHRSRTRSRMESVLLEGPLGAMRRSSARTARAPTASRC